MSVGTLEFTLPPEQEASAPPESRGLARDEVRLLVSEAGAISHARFHDLPRFLSAGDLLVVNDSATLSAAVDARIGTSHIVLHFSTWLDDNSWVVEVRTTDGHPADWSALESGLAIELPDGVSATLVKPWLPAARRLWVAHIAGAQFTDDQFTDGQFTDGQFEWLQKTGRPISYAYVRGRWAADYYRTIFDRTPGSAEMPSAGRPFTDTMVTDLVISGIAVAPITLHTGVSSPEAGEPPGPERFAVPASTARLVNSTRATGGRVVAVGTTVTRALETVGTTDGRIRPGSGWTDLVLNAERPARVIDGLVTGWHAPEASHLFLLEAVVGAREVRTAYDMALSAGYLWHEFGDSALLLR